MRPPYCFLFGAYGWLLFLQVMTASLTLQQYFKLPADILTGLIGHGRPGQKHGVQGDEGGL